VDKCRALDCEEPPESPMGVCIWHQFNYYCWLCKAEPNPNEEEWKQHQRDGIESVPPRFKPGEAHRVERPVDPNRKLYGPRNPAV